MAGRAVRARDAVRVVRYIGLAALKSLRNPGSVLVSPAERALYFFVQTGSVTDWEIPGVGLISPAEQISLPADDCSSPPGPYWLTARSGVLRCTTADELFAAIRGVLREEEDGR